MKKLLFVFVLSMFVSISCDDRFPFDPDHEGLNNKLVKKYPGDLAVEWMKLQMELSRTTPGFNGGLATRAFAYSGLSLYESIVEGMHGYNSVVSFMIGSKVQPHIKSKVIHFPASANAAMALIIKKLIPSASAEAVAKIDSLEAAFNWKFGNDASASMLEKSAEYGREIASTIFEWSEADGFAEAIAKNSSYVIPEGEGLWKPTPPAFAAPVNVYVGDIRTFVPNSASITEPDPPIPYSEEVGSAFYNAVNEVYTISQSLTAEDSITAKTWGEFPANFVIQALRYQQIAIQVVDDANLPLGIAALAFAKNGMALQEAIVSVFHAKYIHNVVRPITYIHEVLGHTEWSTINITPPHPEYPSAHSTIGRASTTVLESIFGTEYSFTDRTHEDVYGSRSYESLEAASDDAARSRVLAGIHYEFSVVVGKKQGEEIGNLINELPFHHSFHPN